MHAVSVTDYKIYQPDFNTYGWPHKHPAINRSSQTPCRLQTLREGCTDDKGLQPYIFHVTVIHAKFSVAFTGAAFREIILRLV